MYDSQKSRLAFAGASFLTVLTWYALPDAVRSRPARTVIKTGLLGVTAVGTAMIPQVFPAANNPASKPRVDLPAPAMAALGVAGAALATAATVWGEKVVFAFGERRRAAGVRCAHTPAALALAVATGAAAVVDWPKVAAGLVHH
ncbi:MAG TPA: hypothetical protein VLR88_07535 [Propionibacteriaceae bacterium]|nr:hypothetical protein [Propionibacteriaceae bacterium]